MKTLLLILTLFTHFGFAATPEQVEQYLLVSNAEEDLLALENQYNRFQNSLSTDPYDMQLLMIRFKENLQKELSRTEMDEILDNYKKIIFLQFKSQLNLSDKDLNISNYSDLKPERKNILESIEKMLYSKETVAIMFDDLMKPFLQNSIGGKNLSDKNLKLDREKYISASLKDIKKNLIASTNDFSDEELQELEEIVKSPSVEHEMKAVYKATAYAFRDFFLSIANKYDLKKHQPKKRTQNKQNI
jgi:ABC-type antimicrobial peptide transport system permease subunit